MYIRRIVIRNFRNFAHLDVPLRPGVTCVIGENNTGKTNLLHAIRLAVDGDLSSRYRRLLVSDIHSQADFSVPNQVLVSVEFGGYKSAMHEFPGFGCDEEGEDVGRVHFRYRPRRQIRDSIESGERDERHLSIAEDYDFELTGGGAIDPASVCWNEELGSPLKFGDLRVFHVEYLSALRDAEHGVCEAHESVVGRLLDAHEITQKEEDPLAEIPRGTNAETESPRIAHHSVGAVSTPVARAAGENFATETKPGLAVLSSSFLVRSLEALFSNASLTDLEPARNGLGIATILYIDMILEWLRKRTVSAKTAGQLLLIEEPEAHLPPHLQRVVYSALAEDAVQVILTTHSAHITSQAPIESYVTLTHVGTPATVACAPCVATGLTAKEAEDLNRFLDATRSPMLYARKVLLVEGPAELFLLPVLVEQVLGINLDRHGIVVVPIYAKRFAPFAKLFGPEAITKKCAIVAAGDGDPNDICGIEEDCLVLDDESAAMENKYVQVFCCPVRFERALTIPGTLRMLAAAAEECGFSSTARQLREGRAQLWSGALDFDEEEELLSTLRGQVLDAAVEFGQARFAQIASRHAQHAKALPQFILEAIKWLTEP